MIRTVVDSSVSVHSWQLGPDGAYRRLDHQPGDFSAHTWFMTNPSLSGRGSALRESRPAMPGELFPETGDPASTEDEYRAKLVKAAV